MRHLRKTTKLGRSPAHRAELMAALACGLIRHRRIETTLAKAKLVRPFAEKMVTLAKAGTLHARRQAIAQLRDKGDVARLFDEVAPVFKDRKGGYTRIVRVGDRGGDGAEVVYLEWIHFVPVAKKSDKDAKGAKEEAAPAAEKKEESAG